MKVSELIYKLSALAYKHGDVEVNVLAVDHMAQESASGPVVDVYFDDDSIIIDNVESQ